MIGFRVVVFVIFFELSAHGLSDLTPEAITVYRNPDFFKNLNYGTKINYDQKSAKVPEEQQASYKYPGETTKPNPPPASPGFEVNYDNSPEFHHEPRDIFVGTTYKPSRKKGPYSPRYHNEKSHESAREVQKPVRENDSNESSRESKENESSRESKENGSSRESKENGSSRESKENDSGAEEPRDFVSVFDENPEEEFQAYHEPILLARPNFDPEKSSGFVSNAYSKPYPYNRTRPILYDEWKFYTYPKIYSNEHLKSDSKIFSEEPSSNSFEDESPSYYGYDDEKEDASNFFENSEFKDLGADTKHIYKKLLKPKKSFIFKFHSKPKLKKLKFKLKKHLHNTDWFDEYPFDF